MAWSARHRASTLSSILLASALLPACVGDPVIINILEPTAAVTVTPGTLTLQQGASAQVVATARDSRQRELNRTLAWSTANPAVATVAGSGTTGTITAVGVGTTTVTAEHDGVTGSVSVTVTPAVTIARPKLSAGEWHTCAVTASGAASCWGFGLAGQLGTGTPADRPAPTGVVDVTGFVTVAAGHQHSCGVRSDGAAYCWGLNDDGQLGNGSTASSSRPVAVQSGSYAVLSAGGMHTCGLRSDGSLLCWGRNDVGQLGSAGGSTSTPRAVGGGPYAAVSAGWDHTCALTATGEALCWGSNALGQIGTGNPGGTQGSPTAVTGGHRFRAIDAGRWFTCGVRTDGAALCWGRNVQGELGNGAISVTPVAAPTTVSGAASFVSVSAGNTHACGLQATGSVYCWGDSRTGAVGNGEEVIRPSAALVAGLGAVREIAAGAVHSCAVLTTGGVECWGSNLSGQLGVGALGYVNAPAIASSVPGTFTQVSAGEGFTCGVRSDRIALCWGQNRFGSTGNPSLRSSSTPNQIAPSPVDQVATGALHGCVLVNQVPHCWGWNETGQLGDGTTTTRPTAQPVTGSPRYVAISAGTFHTCGLDANGQVFCWGGNGDGQLGDGTTTNRLMPVAAAGALRFAQISAGHEHTCGLTAQGRVWCWGSNIFGKVGHPSSFRNPDPFEVPVNGTYTQVEAGTWHTCAVQTGGRAFCWGYNIYGQIGDGGRTSGPTPRTVANVTSFRYVSAGVEQTCGLTTANQPYCWGRAIEGRLGVASTQQDLLVPQPVNGTFSSIDLGAAHACGISNGTILCWGSNEYGNLGNGQIGIARTPVTVAGITVAT